MQKNGTTSPLAFPTEVKAYHGSRISRFEIEFFYDDANQLDSCWSVDNDCFLNQDMKDAKLGSAIFSIVDGRSEILLTLSVPRLNVEHEISREIFAIWTPLFDGKSFESSMISTDYLTDAQGFELMKRKVY